MTQQEFDAKYPAIAGWIQQTITEHEDLRCAVASLGFKRLPHYFTPELLAFAKVAYVDSVPTPPLSAIGLHQFTDFELMEPAGITYFDTIISRQEMRGNEAHLFHELVHVIQWKVLGPKNFTAAYADGLERVGYRQSPLEVVAYTLESAFRNGAGPFDVFAVVREQVGALAPVSS